MSETREQQANRVADQLQGKDWVQATFEASELLRAMVADLAAARAEADRLRGAMGDVLEFRCKGRAPHLCLDGILAALDATPATGQGSSDTERLDSVESMDCRRRAGGDWFVQDKDDPSLWTIADKLRGGIDVIVSRKAAKDRLRDALEATPATGGGIVAGMEALREAGGGAWDRVEDVAGELGRDSGE